MSYQVLARRLRPKGFDALVGQDHVVRALRNGLDSGRIHHAYLFTGTRGVGKTTIARILAKCLNCEQGVSSTPCGACSICREVEENRFMDLIEVDAASRTKVDDTRELLDNAQYKPSRGRFKVYLIDEVHMLSASSFNAFLKTLEEPPEHVKFLLATTDPKKVPVTVLSRCLQFQLKNIGRDEIARYIGDVLTGEEIDYEIDALRIIAKSAQGSMRDALSITDQAIAYGGGSLAAADVAAMVGAAGRDEIGAVVEALASGEPRRVLELSAALADKAADFRSVLAELLEALHAMAVDQALGEAAQGGLTQETVQLYYQIALLGYRDLFVGPDPKTGFEMTLLRMLAFAPDAESAARVPAAAGATQSGAPKNSRGGAAKPLIQQNKSLKDVRSGSKAETSQSPSQTIEARKPVEARKPAETGKAMEARKPADTRKSVKSDKPAEAHKPLRASTSPAGPNLVQTRESVEASRSAAARKPEEGGEPTKAINSAKARESEKSTEPSSNELARGVRAEPVELDAQQSASKIKPAKPEHTPGANEIEDWYELVGRMGLKGIDRMIAEHALPVDRRGGTWRLVLDRKHASLLSGAKTKGVERALAAALGESVRLQVDVGDPEHETPAMRNDRIARERRAAARRDLEQNPTVQSLLELFDGRLEDVRPLQEPTTEETHR